MNKRNIIKKENKFLIYFKIILSIAFVLAVSSLVIKSCVREASGPVYQLPVTPRAKPAPVQPIPKKVRMAIILDDWGNNFTSFDEVLKIKRPITLAILPHLRYSRRIAEAAKANGLGVMLHMPMQPLSKTQPLEPHTILTTTPDQEVLHYLDTALENVPYAEGVNNHMGSRAVADRRVMLILLKELKRKGLFFIDSYTNRETLGPKMAKELGIPFAKRDVFLDSQMNALAIKKQIFLAKKLALKYGSLVVIGHDRDLTLKLIQKMVPELEKEGIKFVLAKELLKK